MISNNKCHFLCNSSIPWFLSIILTLVPGIILLSKPMSAHVWQLLIPTSFLLLQFYSTKSFKNAYMTNNMLGNSIRLMTEKLLRFLFVWFCFQYLYYFFDSVHMQVLHKTLTSQWEYWDKTHFVLLWRLAFDPLMRSRPQFSIHPPPIFIKCIELLCWMLSSIWSQWDHTMSWLVKSTKIEHCGQWESSQGLEQKLTSWHILLGV